MNVPETLDFVSNNFGPFVTELQIDKIIFKGRQFNIFLFIQKFKSLKRISVSNFTQDDLCQLCQAQKSNLNLKVISVRDAIGTTNSIGFILEELTQIEEIMCDWKDILNIDSSFRFNNLKMLTPVGSAIDQDNDVIYLFPKIETLFPKLKEIALLLTIKYVQIIPEEYYPIVTAICLENDFESMAENVRIIAKSMPNCKNLTISLLNYPLPDVKSYLVKMENVTRFVLSCHSIQLEDVCQFHDQMPMLSFFKVRTRIRLHNFHMRKY